MKPRAHGSDRDVERERDLLVAELGERVQEQRITLAWPHRREGACKPCVEGRPVDSSDRLVVVGGPPVDSGPTVRAQLTALGAPVVMEQIRRDPVEPREDAPARAPPRPLRVRECERLCRQIVGEVAPGASMEVGVDGVEVPVEDHPERLRLGQGPRHALHVRRNRIHHPDCARSRGHSFSVPDCGSDPHGRAPVSRAFPARYWAGRRMSEREGQVEHDAEHQVTPLELFFDLTFVFAMTQVTILLADDPTWGGVFRGMLVLAALWWGWGVYAWLSSAMDVDEGGVRLLVLAAMGGMFGAALAVPGAFGDDALLFGVAYLLVRVLHLALSALVVRDDPERREALVRFVPTAMLAPCLIVVAGLLEGRAQIVLWLVALAIDYLGPIVIGVGRGWRVAPEHFAERHGLIVLIALGESIIAIGLGAGFELDAGVVVAAALGLVVVSALWWLYFDVASILARGRLLRATGLDLHRLALHAYSYLHLPIVAGVVLFALGLKTTVADVGEPLETVPAFALCGGAALYLAGHVAFLHRCTGRIFRRRTIGAVVLLTLAPVAVLAPALAALALVSAVCVLVVAYEAIRYREQRLRVRHPEDAA
jgi:low temperature requirement protein LtrA